MKKSIILALALVFTAFLAKAQVKSDYSKDTDFSKYKTYAIAGWQEDSSKQLNDIDRKRVTDALNEGFAARGMTLVEDTNKADAVVVLYLVLDEKTSTTAYTNYTGGMGFGAGWGWGMGPGMASSTTNYEQSDYTVGTFVIDMYDGTSKTLVWQGVISKTVTENPQKREKTIPKSMNKLMESYPVAEVKK